MPLPKDTTWDIQALDSQVEHKADLPDLPGQSEVEAHVESRGAKSAECAVYAVLKHNRIEVKFANWDFGKKRCADDFEKFLNEACGPNIVYGFSCEPRGSSSCKVIFRITWEAEERLDRKMDKRIKDAIYEHSGKDKLRIKCEPGMVGSRAGTSYKNLGSPRLIESVIRARLAYPYETNGRLRDLGPPQQLGSAGQLIAL